MAVNLLPWRAIQRKKRIQRLCLLFIFGLILIVIGWSILSAKQILSLMQQHHKTNQLQQRIQAINIDYQRYLTTNQQQQQQAQTDNYIKNTLLTDRMLLQLLRELGEQMPPGMYLTQIQKNNKSFGFSGKSTSHAEITLLLKQLEHSHPQRQPRLTETRHADRQNPEIDFDLIYENY